MCIIYLVSEVNTPTKKFLRYRAKSVAYWAAHAFHIRRTCNMVNLAAAEGGAEWMVCGFRRWCLPEDARPMFVYKKAARQQQKQRRQEQQKQRKAAADDANSKFENCYQQTRVYLCACICVRDYCVGDYLSMADEAHQLTAVARCVRFRLAPSSVLGASSSELRTLILGVLEKYSKCVPLSPSVVGFFNNLAASGN